MTVSPDLDLRFREAASTIGLIDIGYDLVESPIGELLVATTDRGVASIWFDPDPAEDLERLAASEARRSPLSAQRRSRAPRARRVLRRQRRASTSTSICAHRLRSRARSSASSHAFPTARRRRTARWRSGSATLGPRAVGTVMNATASRSSFPAIASSARTGASPATRAASTARRHCSNSKARGRSDSGALVCEARGRRGHPGCVVSRDPLRPVARQGSCATGISVWDRSRHRRARVPLELVPGLVAADQAHHPLGACPEDHGPIEEEVEWREHEHPYEVPPGASAGTGRRGASRMRSARR